MTMTDAAADDRLLYGVSAIADFLGVKQRVAEHLVRTKSIPFFKRGRTVCARPSSIRAKIEQMEAAAMRDFLRDRA